MRSLLLAALVSVALHVPADARTAGELLNDCEAFLRDVTFEGTAVRVAPNSRPCWDYMGAIGDMTTVVDANGRSLLGLCIPSGVRLTQSIRIFTGYARANPNMLHHNAVSRRIPASFPVRPEALMR